MTNSPPCGTAGSVKADVVKETIAKCCANAEMIGNDIKKGKWFVKKTESSGVRRDQTQVLLEGQPVLLAIL